MKNPFITPDKILEKKNNYSLNTEKHQGDGFFIDKKYQGKIGSNVPHKKLNHLLGGILIIILLLISRIFYLQIIKNKEYRAIAEGNRIKIEILPSPRGTIYDRYHQPLTTNIPQFSLFIEHAALNNPYVNQEELINKVAEITSLNQTEIEEKINLEKNISQDILISNKIDYSQAIILQSNPENFNGLKLQLIPQRVYYNSNYNLSHLLGYLGKIDQTEWEELKYKNYEFFDFIGKAGLEKEYEEILHGQSGRIEREVDAQGNIIKIINEKPAEPGKDLMLTIDQKLNAKLFEILNDQIKKINCTKATALALDPRNGEILALVSLPSFDNNIFSNPTNFSQTIDNLFNDFDQPLFNRAIAGEYPSGSTFKPVLAAAALQENLITQWTQILSVGGISIEEDWFFPDWKAGGHGMTNITKALAESVNTFFYYIGGGYKNFKGLGLEKIISYANKFNFGKILDIDLPSEAKGFLPSMEWRQETKKEPWYIGDTYHLSIGQGDILVTPLQIANLTATIANGGKIYQPHLIKEIIDNSKKSSQKIKSKILNQNFIDEKNIQIVQQGLRQAVVSGSAKYLSDLPFSTAGKTGTAQVGGDENPHAWFTVYAPDKNPEIVLTILIENGGDGSATALPVAKEVLKWYFNH